MYCEGYAVDTVLGFPCHHAWLYNVATGGCRDGLHEDRLNENQGAEATLSFQLALAEMRDLAAEHAGDAQESL